MTWPVLGSRIGGLPTVLAGPILRTVTRTSVTVWLALKESATVTLSIYASDSATTALISSPATPATKVGPNLYIIAVTASATPAQFALGTVYFYNLSLVTANGPENLLQATRATSAAAFAYPPYQNPSFLLPPNDLEQVRFALGSCRKMHTGGENGPDALALLDDMLAANATTPVQRAQLLVLGGDQIYADEVAETLLLMLTDAGETLIGPEWLPQADGTFTNTMLHPPSTRSAVIKAAGFTSDDTRSHLMGLGEYIAMYLFAWSDVLWPKAADVPTIDDVLAVAPISARADYAEMKAAKELKAEIPEQQKNIVATLETLPKVRRALANIATYMILDDHEITDDWNMQRRFCDSVYGDPLGMRIVQNGLIAYAFCQHWGNCPEQFTGTMPGATLLNLFATAETGYLGIASSASLLQIVGLHTPAQLQARTPYAVYHDANSLTYNYTIEGEAFQLVVTDTRTWRAFPRAGKLSPPDLIERTQFAVQIGSTPPLGNRLLLVLVTTNMPPCPAIRQAGRDLPGLPGHAFDFEDFFDSWQIEQIDFARMVVEISRKFVANPLSPYADRVVLLSGDVHSSQASRMLYTATEQVGDLVNAPTSAKVVFAQIIASALHNGSDATLGEHISGYDFVPPKFSARLGAQNVLLTENFVGWNPQTTTPKMQLGEFEVTAASLFTPIPAKLRLNFDPDRPTVTTRSQNMGNVWSAPPPIFSEKPHYQYRLDYLRNAAAGVEVTVPPAPSATPIASHAAASFSYQTMYVDGGLEQVGKSNIGELTFAKGSTGNPDWITQFMVRWSANESVLWVRFDVSLDPDDKEYLQSANSP